MSKKRIYELAKELNVSNKEVIEVAKKNGFKVGNHMSSLDQAAEAKVKASFVKPVKASSQKQATPKKENSEKKQNVAVNKNSQNARNNNHSKHQKQASAQRNNERHSVIGMSFSMHKKEEWQFNG